MKERAGRISERLPPSEELIRGAGNVALRFEPYRFTQPPFDVALEAMNLLRPKPSDRIADLGSREGEFLMRLRLSRDHRGELIGIDPWYEPTAQLYDPAGNNSRLILPRNTVPHEVLEQLNTKHFRSFAEDLPFKDESMDIITAFFMMYMLSKEEQESVISEVRRVLRPDGTFLLSTSGDFNKARHRVFERLIAEALEVEPPELMNRTFDSERAAQVLPASFANVYQYSYRGHMVFKRQPQAITYQHSLVSMSDFFRPPVGDEDVYEAFRKRVAPIILKEMRQLGSFSDYVERDIFICGDNPDGLTVYEPTGQRVIKGYEKVLAIPSNHTTADRELGSY